MWHKWMLCFLCVCVSLQGEELSTQLEKCFTEVWGVDAHTTSYLLNKFQPFLDTPDHQHLVTQFIEKSQGMGIDYSAPKEARQLLETDPILRAPQNHYIVFENLHVRVILGLARAGETEPYHIHSWKGIMVVLKPTTYEVEYEDSNGPEIWDGTIGVYSLSGGGGYTCTNIGPETDECLRFEVKD